MTETQALVSELVSQLAPDLLALYERGLVRVEPGRDPAKPVVRWAQGKDKGRFAPGSGVTPVHFDSENGKKGALKQLPEYRALFERLIEESDDPSIRGSFAWIIDYMFEAVEGESITKECPECGHNVYMYKKPDITAAKYLIDQVAGKPIHRTEVDVDITTRHEELRETFDGTELKVHRIDPMEARRRREALESDEVGSIEGVIVDEDSID